MNVIYKNPYKSDVHSCLFPPKDYVINSTCIYT